MRLWSLHPKYLDPKGLVALWREGLLAQAVLAGKTKGYKHHPQLRRILAVPAPRAQIAVYLRAVHEEAVRRRYHFDARKIGKTGNDAQLLVTRGQLDYEWAHLGSKLEVRAPSWLRKFASVKRPEPHPMFRVVAGGIADWEIVTPPRRA